MKNKIAIFCALFFWITFFSFSAKADCPNPMADGMKICADFEEDDNLDENIWSHYLERGFIQDIAGKKDRFTADSDSPFGGSFSARSMDPNGHIFNDYDTDSFFVVDPNTVFGREMTFGDDLFIRYAAKFPLDWEGEATDYYTGGVSPSGGANHLRVNGNDNRSIEAAFGEGWLHGGSVFWYDTGDVQWSTNFFIKDNQWHVYAIHIKMPSSSVASDGAIRMWRDNDGSYAIEDAIFHQENVVQTENFNRIAVTTPCYYKGPVFPVSVDGHVSSGNWTF
ncbi:MAG: hypothetical protein Athens071425_265, partial [Parcubacteria group bacterium Athens0714_25]